MKALKRKSDYPLWPAVPGLVIYTVFFIVPILTAFFYSFTSWNLNDMSKADFVWLRNYKSLLRGDIFLRSVGNTLLFAAVTTVFKTLVGLLLALLVVKPFPGNSLFRTLYYLPCVLSTMIVGLLFTAILRQNGLLNNILTSLGMESLTRDWLGSYGTAMLWIILTEIWMWAGFSMFIFISGLQAISRDYYESAELDGAGAWQRFWHITMPLLAPSFTVITTLNITGGLKVFDIVYALTGGGPGFDTQVLSTYVYRAFGLGLLGKSSAAAILLSIVIVAVTFALNRFLRSMEVER